MWSEFINFFQVQHRSVTYPKPARKNPEKSCPKANCVKVDDIEIQAMHPNKPTDHKIAHLLNSTYFAMIPQMNLPDTSVAVQIIIR